MIISSTDTTSKQALSVCLPLSDPQYERLHTITHTWECMGVLSQTLMCLHTVAVGHHSVSCKRHVAQQDGVFFFF